jgi:hypothetical protein
MPLFDSLPRDALVLGAAGIVASALMVLGRWAEDRRREERERAGAAAILGEVRAAIEAIKEGLHGQGDRTERLDEHVRAVFRVFYAIARRSGIPVDKRYADDPPDFDR